MASPEDGLDVVSVSSSGPEFGKDTPSAVPSKSYAARQTSTDVYDPRTLKDGTSIGRILDAMGVGASAGYGEELLWFAPGTKAHKETVDAGMYNSINASIINPIKAFNEITLSGAAAAADLLFRRAPGVVFGAIGGGLYQTDKELGFPVHRLAGYGNPEEGHSKEALANPKTQRASIEQAAKTFNEAATIALIAMGGEAVYRGYRPYDPKVIPNVRVEEVPIAPAVAETVPSTAVKAAAAKIDSVIESPTELSAIKQPETPISPVLEKVTAAAPVSELKSFSSDIKYKGNIITKILPQELRGAKSRYNIGQNQYIPIFESDIDRALFITSQVKKSKADEQYRGWLKKQGYTDEEIVSQGKIVRDNIKDIAKRSEPGEIAITSIAAEPKGTVSTVATPVVEAPTPTVNPPVVAPVGEAPASVRISPTFEEFRHSLPKDKDGSYDIAGVGNQLMNGKAWLEMTDAEKIAAIRGANPEWKPAIQLRASVTLEQVKPADKPLERPNPHTVDPEKYSSGYTNDHEWKLNTRHITSRDDVIPFMLTSVAENRDMINQSRRGQMTHVEIQQAAIELGLDYADLVRASDSGNNMLLAENMTATRMLHVRLANEALEANIKYGETGSEADLLVKWQADERLTWAQEVTIANLAEQGRGLSSNMINVEAAMAAGDISKAVGETGIVNPIRVIEAVRDIDRTDPVAVEAALKEAGIPNIKEVGEAIKDIPLVKTPKVETPVVKGEEKVATSKAKKASPPTPKEITDVGEALSDKGINNMEQARKTAKLVGKMKSPAQVAKARQALAKSKGFIDIAIEVGINWMLTNWYTHVVNITYNTMTAFRQPIETVGAALLETGKAVLTGKERDVLYGQAAGQLYGIFEGFPEGLRAAWTAIKEEKPTFGERKIEGNVHQAIPTTETWAIAKANEEGHLGDAWVKRVNELKANPPKVVQGVSILGHTVRSPGTALMASDEIFKGMAIRGSLNSQAYLAAHKAGLKGNAFDARVQYLKINPTDLMKKQAIEEAGYQTLTNSLGKFGKKVQKALEEVPLMKFAIAPFVRTPTNAVKMELTRTPLAPLGMLRAGKLRDDMLGKNGSAAQSIALSRMILGSAMLAGFIKWAATGRLNGGGPDPKTDQKAYDAWRAEGNIPYSYQVGGTWRSTRELGVLATPLGIAADAYEIHKHINLNDASDIGSLLMYSLGNNILNKTWTQGAMQAFGAVEDWDRNGESFLKSLSGRIIPSGIAEYSREQDPYLRDAREWYDSIKARTPWSTELGFKYDVFGEPLLKTSRVSEIRTDPVLKALKDVDLFPSRMSRTVMGIELTDQEYEEFTRNGGIRLKAALASVVANPYWNSFSYGFRQTTLAHQIRKSRDLFTTYFYLKHPRLMQQTTKDTKDRLRTFLK